MSPSNRVELGEEDTISQEELLYFCNFLDFFSFHPNIRKCCLDEPIKTVSMFRVFNDMNKALECIAPDILLPISSHHQLNFWENNLDAECFVVVKHFVEMF